MAMDYIEKGSKPTVSNGTQNKSEDILVVMALEVMLALGLSPQQAERSLGRLEEEAKRLAEEEALRRIEGDRRRGCGSYATAA